MGVVLGGVKMVKLRVIKGGRFSEPDEIPAPDKPNEEWTIEERDAYHAYLYDHAEEGTVEYSVKYLDEPREDIAAALRVLEAISQSCAAAAKKVGIINEFELESARHLLRILRRRVKNDNE